MMNIFRKRILAGEGLILVRKFSREFYFREKRKKTQFDVKIRDQDIIYLHQYMT